VPTRILTILNQHGNSLVLAMKHKDNRDPKNWKGFKFAIPFDTSHQAMQLRYYLAQAGLNPDKDVSFRVVPPSEYVSNLRTGNVDGFLGGEPGGQRAVYDARALSTCSRAISGKITPAVRLPHWNRSSNKIRTPIWRFIAALSGPVCGLRTTKTGPAWPRFWRCQTT
jgi:NMT1-like family